MKTLKTNPVAASFTEPTRVQQLCERRSPRPRSHPYAQPHPDIDAQRARAAHQDTAAGRWSSSAIATCLHQSRRKKKTLFPIAHSNCFPRRSLRRPHVHGYSRTVLALEELLGDNASKTPQHVPTAVDDDNLLMEKRSGGRTSDTRGPGKDAREKDGEYVPIGGSEASAFAGSAHARREPGARRSSAGVRNALDEYRRRTFPSILANLQRPLLRSSACERGLRRSTPGCLEDFTRGAGWGEATTAIQPSAIALYSRATR